MDLNKAMLIGRLTRDAEAKGTPKGGGVTTFSVATSREWKNEKGEKEKHTEFSPVVMWGKMGQGLLPYLKKGKQVYVEGRFQTNEWEGKDGTKKTRTEIVAESVLLLGSKDSNPPTP